MKRWVRLASCFYPASWRGRYAVEFAAEKRRGAERGGVLNAGAGGERGLRTVARQSLRHVFVDRANLGALRVELRIALIGAHQGGFDGLGHGGRGACEGHQQNRRRNPVKTFHTHERAVCVHRFTTGHPRQIIPAKTLSVLSV